MAAPSLQLGAHGSNVNVFWDQDPTVNGGIFTIYIAPALTGPFTKVGQEPNVANMGKKSIQMTFARSAFGYSEKNSFFLAGTFTPPGGAETPLGNTRFVAAVVDQKSSTGAANSPLTVSERFPAKVGTGAVRLSFSMDVKQLEVFNFNKSYTIFVDITGLDATLSDSMPVLPMGYYALGIHVPKDSGISLISEGDDTDVRIVAHY